MSSRRAALAGVIALLALQLLWHGVLLPPRSTSPWIYAAFFCLPLLPAIWLARPAMSCVVSKSRSTFLLIESVK